MCHKALLGPLLSLMFIKNIPQVVKFPSLIYSDDLKLWEIIKEPGHRKLAE